jgi:hypothetical protein
VVSDTLLVALVSSAVAMSSLLVAFQLAALDRHLALVHRRVDLGQQLTLFDRRLLLHVDLDDIAGSIRTDVDQVRVQEGVA